MSSTEWFSSLVQRMAVDCEEMVRQLDEREKEIERRDAELLKGMCIAPFPFTITRMTNE